MLPWKQQLVYLILNTDTTNKGKVNIEMKKCNNK